MHVNPLPQHTLYRLHPTGKVVAPGAKPLPQHTLYRLHLRPITSSPRLGTLPQHTLYRLHLAVTMGLLDLHSFASAHSIQVASRPVDTEVGEDSIFASAHSIQVASTYQDLLAVGEDLCLSTLYTGCIFYQFYCIFVQSLCLSTLYTGCIG